MHEAEGSVLLRCFLRHDSIWVICSNPDFFIICVCLRWFNLKRNMINLAHYLGIHFNARRSELDWNYFSACISKEHRNQEARDTETNFCEHYLRFEFRRIENILIRPKGIRKGCWQRLRSRDLEASLKSPAPLHAIPIQSSGYCPNRESRQNQKSGRNYSCCCKADFLSIIGGQAGVNFAISLQSLHRFAQCKLFGWFLIKSVNFFQFFLTHV